MPVLPGKHRISLEIKMVVVGAGGIEGGEAVGAAGIAMEVPVNGQFPFAGAAQNGELIEFGARPDGDWVVGQGHMAIFAGIVEAAAVHFDGDDVEWGVEVNAAGLRIEMDAADSKGLVGRLATHESSVRTRRILILIKSIGKRWKAVKMSEKTQKALLMMNNKLYKMANGSASWQIRRN